MGVRTYVHTDGRPYVRPSVHRYVRPARRRTSSVLATSYLPIPTPAVARSVDDRHTVRTYGDRYGWTNVLSTSVRLPIDLRTNRQRRRMAGGIADGPDLAVERIDRTDSLAGSLPVFVRASGRSVGDRRVDAMHRTIVDRSTRWDLPACM